MNELKSSFAVKIAEMLEWREALGYKAETHRAYLQAFDTFCHENYPTASELTEPCDRLQPAASFRFRVLKSVA
jgi:hypothetical protein